MADHCRFCEADFVSGHACRTEATRDKCAEWDALVNSRIPQFIQVVITRLKNLADTALDGRLYEKECQEQMRLAAKLLRDNYTADGRDRLFQENSLLKSQLANCNAEIKRLREAMLSLSPHDGGGA
jgi:hypothetical protein